MSNSNVLSKNYKIHHKINWIMEKYEYYNFKGMTSNNMAEIHAKAETV